MPCMTLSDWLKANNTRQADFASRIGVTQGHVSQLCRGGMPSLEVAAAIERETGGAIPAASWVTHGPAARGHNNSSNPTPAVAT